MRSRRGVLVALAALVAVACGGGGAGPARPVPRVAEIDEIVRLEGAREGHQRLLELAQVVEPPVRRRALLALGRHGEVGDVPFIAQSLGDENVREAAAEALGLIGDVSAGPALVAALADDEQAEGRWLVAALAALGRCGDELDAPDAIARWLLASDPATRGAAARALGALGQRKLPIHADVLERLVEAGGDPDAGVRHGVAYALMRAVLPGGAPPEVRAALVKLAADEDAEVRAMALRGLGLHGAAAEPVVAGSLEDEDWRVRVQAVRALTAETATPAEHALVAAFAGREAKRAQAGHLGAHGDGHALEEAVARLTELAVKHPELASTLLAVHAAIAPSVTAAPELERRLYEQVHCAAAAGVLRARGAAAGADDVARVRGCGRQDQGAPSVSTLLVLMPLVAQKLVPEAESQQLVESLAGAEDVRLRAAAAEAAVGWLPAAWASKVVDKLLLDLDLMVVAVAAEALTPRLVAEAALDATTHLSRITIRLIDSQVEPEAQLSMIGALCARPLLRWRGGVAAGHVSTSGVVREAARKCLTEIDGEDPGPGVASAAAPRTPADPVSVLGKRIVLEVTTGKGVFVVELDGDLAPWNVATLAHLASAGYYAGTTWHRVVPDFVVQGGDPTGTGWGGPGFSVPAEASQARYVRGAVGIADGGKDTGGSQWFVMHSPAPHLEQRYTLVGMVTSGIEVVDRLYVGDQIVSVKVRIK